jgi:hypothetical protein
LKHPEHIRELQDINDFQTISNQVHTLLNVFLLLPEINIRNWKFNMQLMCLKLLDLQSAISKIDYNEKLLSLTMINLQKNSQE